MSCHPAVDSLADTVPKGAPPHISPPLKPYKPLSTRTAPFQPASKCMFLYACAECQRLVLLHTAQQFLTPRAATRTCWITPAVYTSLTSPPISWVDTVSRSSDGAKMRACRTGASPIRGANSGVSESSVLCPCVSRTSAGEEGFFRIRRGQNDCGFEAGVLAGMLDI